MRAGRGRRSRSRLWTFSREGWQSQVTLTLTVDAVQHTDYILMLQVPNGGDARSNGVGPLNTIWTDQAADEVVADQSDNSNTNLGARRGFAAAGGGYAVYAALIGSTVTPVSTLIRDLTSFHAKAYALSDADGTNGTPRPAGYSVTTIKEWAVRKGSYA